MIGLLGKKLGMTQIFDEEGRQVGVTVLTVGPCHVTDIKNKEKHGYKAVQLAFDAVKEKAEAISPVPGGVVPMLVTMLIYSTVQSAKLADGLK